MADFKLQLKGVEELREALKKLPPELVREAGVIVDAQAEAAAREIMAAYPVRTGNLRNRVTVELRADAVSATARVRNMAKHSYIYEVGTGPRRWTNGKSTGSMPAGHVFIPIAMQRRRIMLAALIDLLERSGLHVSGAAG